MKILLINPPHPAIGSRIPHEHLPPLGLLSIGGPLLDAGHEVRLLDAEFGPMSTGEILSQATHFNPAAILIGHSGSTSGHPAVIEITRALRKELPAARIIYGGVFPTYHWREVLAAEPQIDFIVRGEGEVTMMKLIAALEAGTDDGSPCGSRPSKGLFQNLSSSGSRRQSGVATEPLCASVSTTVAAALCRRADSGDTRLHRITGIAFRRNGKPYATSPASPIYNLDEFRVGWELIDFARYSYWGDRRAVVVQFSRGCPHHCAYCGQRGFWTRWRHRNPKRFAAEIAWLHRIHGVEVFNLADENPTANRTAWLAFIVALIAEKVNVTLVGSTRADNIVRDADILHLYKKAGVARWLLGIENYDEHTLNMIRKNGSTSADRLAIQLLRRHGILSMATWVVGFEEERDRDYLRGLRQLLAYDPDQIQMLFATPHRWTPYYRMEAGRRVIQADPRRWDYKHQVLATRYIAPWRVLLWTKFIEAVMQLRPRALRRVLAHPDKPIRAAQRWYYRIGRRVWPHEIWNFFFRDRRLKNGPTLTEFWGQPQDAEENAMKEGSPLMKTLLPSRATEMVSYCETTGLPELTDQIKSQAEWRQQ